jgi:hypothetical protein
MIRRYLAQGGRRHRRFGLLLSSAIALAVVCAASLLTGCAAGRPSATTSGATTSAPSVTAPTTTSTSLLPLSAALPVPWYLTRGGTKHDQGWAVTTDPQGNIYFGTHQQDPAAAYADMLIYKFAPDGREVWKTRWGGRFMEKTFVVVAAGDRVLVGGLQYSSANPLDADMAVLSLDAATGKVAWSFTWGQGYGYEEVDGLAVEGGDIYVSGWTTGKTTGNDVALLKLTGAGKLVWAQTWGTDGWDQGDGQLAVDADAVYVAGRYNGANMLAGGKGFVAKFSKDTGKLVSDQTWGGPIFTDALGLTADADHLYVVGLTLDRGKGGQIFLRKYDKGLRLVWERIWGGVKSESARAVTVDGSGNVLVAGETASSGAGGLDIVLLRYSSKGDLLWAHTWGGPKDEGALGIALHGGSAFIAGKTGSFGNGGDEAVLIAVDAATGLFPAPGAKPVSQ